MPREDPTHAEIIAHVDDVRRAVARHDALIDRVEDLRQLIEDNREMLRESRHQLGQVAAVTALAADRIPSHEKSIDALWSVVRTNQQAHPTMDQHAQLTELVERITSRLEVLEADRLRREGRKLGTEQAYEALREKVTVILKALGVLTGTGAGAGAAFMALRAIAAWVGVASW